MTSRSTRAVVAVAASLFAVSGLAACSSGGSTSAGGGSKSSTSDTVKITLAQSGCKSEAESYDAGALTFTVQNTDATGATEIELRLGERIIGEKENLPPGFSGSFSLQVAPGDYTLYCPGAKTEKSTLTVTGTASTTPPSTTKGILIAGAKSYQGYVEVQVASMVTTAATLQSAIKSGNLKAAQDAYAKARPYYERIEPVAESFPDIDAAIDSRADDVPAAKLTGYHRIEYGLFTVKSTTGLGPIVDQLVANIAKLKTLVAGLNGFQPAELANGAVGLLDEASKNKITGEEERYSHIDILDFSANVEGAQQAFAYLEAGLDKIDPTLTASIKAAFTNVTTLLDDYKDPTQASGFKPYSALTKADLTKLAQAIRAVAEPLSTVAGKVVNA